MKILLFTLFMSCSVLSSVYAGAMDDETRGMANKVMQNIFDRVVFEKGRHEELSAFDKENLSLNDRQVYVIKYERQEKAAAEDYQPYGFALTILPLDDPFPDAWKEGGFEFSFPLLDLKFSGYQRRAINGRFDIQSAIQRYGQILLEYQQQHMPLRVAVSTDKDSYKTGEEIVFTVTLTNVTSQIMRVLPLNAENLYILYDGRRYLTADEPSRGDRRYVMLDPDKSLSKTFHGDAFQFAREVEIYASYNMTFEDIKPFAARKVKIYE